MDMDDQWTLLITGGGDGAGSIFSAAQAISEARLPAQLIIACGRNEALRRRLERCLLKVPCRVLGFQDNMPDLMKVADIVVGKAGALTIGEAVASQRPLIILHPPPGQEKANARFVAHHVIGLEVTDTSALIHILEGWMANPSEIEELVARAKDYRYQWSQAATRVASAVMAMMDREEMRSC